MTGTTIGGLVYPLPSEPVRDGAARMQYFLEQLDQDPIETVAYRDQAMTVPNQAWTKMPTWTGFLYQHGQNTEIAVSPSGVSIKRTGRYWVDASWEAPDANVNGHIAVGFDNITQSGAPSMLTNYAAMIKASGWKQTIHAVGRVNLTSGQTYTIWVFQSSGVAIQGATFRLNVAQIAPGQKHS